MNINNLDKYLNTLFAKKKVKQFKPDLSFETYLLNDLKGRLGAKAKSSGEKNYLSSFLSHFFLPRYALFPIVMVFVVLVFASAFKRWKNPSIIKTSLQASISMAENDLNNLNTELSDLESLLSDTQLFSDWEEIDNFQL